MAWRGWSPRRSGSTGSRRSLPQQARSEQTIAQTKAENDWRIARAEILSKNLNVLSAQGPGSADQRFGVLLSLTRGAIIDPELAVSYAMELGKDNPTYMRTVLEATGQKNYQQLAQGFKLTCAQRFGVQKATDICKDDALAERSDAIAEVVSDEMDATAAVARRGRQQPDVAAAGGARGAGLAGRLEWLFEPYLQDLYERRVWQEIQRFEDFATGAHLVAALALATARTGEMVSTAEAGAGREVPRRPPQVAGVISARRRPAAATAAASWSTRC